MSLLHALHDELAKVLSLPKTEPVRAAPERPVSKLSFVVVDDYLDAPDVTRIDALSRAYYRDERFYQGQRSTPERPESHKKAFERLLGRKITKWDYPVNGAFQWCTPEDKIVYHMDTQEWAAVLYLTPEAPPECGTSFFRSKTGIRPWRMDPRLEAPGHDESVYQVETDRIFRGGFFDKTRFEEVDRIGNVYNRLVLWNAKLLHAATSYFGQNLTDARLFQIFFFDVEAPE